jgi:hypothetical protein
MTDRSLANRLGGYRSLGAIYWHRKIAQWYFKELCRCLKNGIFIPENPTKVSRMRL